MAKVLANVSNRALAFLNALKNVTETERKANCESLQVYALKMELAANTRNPADKFKLLPCLELIQNLETNNAQLTTRRNYAFAVLGLKFLKYCGLDNTMMSEEHRKRIESANNKMLAESWMPKPYKENRKLFGLHTLVGRKLYILVVSLGPGILTFAPTVCMQKIKQLTFDDIRKTIEHINNDPDTTLLGRIAEMNARITGLLSQKTSFTCTVDDYLNEQVTWIEGAHDSTPTHYPPREQPVTQPMVIDPPSRLESLPRRQVTMRVTNSQPPTRSTRTN